MKYTLGTFENLDYIFGSFENLDYILDSFENLYYVFESFKNSRSINLILLKDFLKIILNNLKIWIIFFNLSKTWNIFVNPLKIWILFLNFSRKSIIFFIKFFWKEELNFLNHSKSRIPFGNSRGRAFQNICHFFETLYFEFSKRKKKNYLNS